MFGKAKLTSAREIDLDQEAYVLRNKTDSSFPSGQFHIDGFSEP